MLLPNHERELTQDSGISRDAINARGYRSVTADDAYACGYAPSQARAGLLIPQWTLAGVQVGYLLKPDEPRLNDQGKVLKYEAPAGSIPHFDMHPEAIGILNDASTPLTFTEGSKKADSAWSRGIPCVSVTGVWMFLNKRMVVPDLDEIALEGRSVRIVFDSDVMTKPAVEEALLRFAAVLHRRGAHVSLVYLPSGDDGKKVGLDDWLADGNSVGDLDEMERTWTADQGPGVWLSDDDTDKATLKRELHQARSDTRALIRMIKNPEVSRQRMILAVSVATEAMHKVTTGQAEPNGKVILNTAEISDDWRGSPAPGEHIEPLNPGGTRPRMSRDKVNKEMAAAVEEELLSAKPIDVPKIHNNGVRYTMTEWVVDPPRSIAEAIKPMATYHDDTPKIRKPRTLTPPCPHCNEVHPIQRQDWCVSCGGLVHEETIQPVLAEDGDNLSPSSNGAHDEQQSGSPSTNSPLTYLPRDEWTDREDGDNLSPSYNHAEIS